MRNSVKSRGGRRTITLRPKNNFESLIANFNRKNQFELKIGTELFSSFSFLKFFFVLFFLFSQIFFFSSFSEDN